MKIEDGKYLWKDINDREMINFGEYYCGRMFMYFSMTLGRLANMFDFGDKKGIVESAEKFEKALKNSCPGELIKINLNIILEKRDDKKDGNSDAKMRCPLCNGFVANMDGSEDIYCPNGCSI